MHDVKFTRDSIFFLDPISNSIVYEILNESNAITSKYSELMKSLNELSFPKSFDFCYLLSPKPAFEKTQNELNRIGDEITELDQKHLIPWVDKCSNFALNPKYTLQGSLEPHQVVEASIHWTSYLRYRNNQQVDSIRMLYSMHHLEYDRFQTKLANAYRFRMNFWFASSGYILALVLAIIV